MFYDLSCFDDLSCVRLEASEKMLKAWQENEERAAAFAQVTHVHKTQHACEEHSNCLSVQSLTATTHSCFCPAGGRGEPLG